MLCLLEALETDLDVVDAPAVGISSVLEAAESALELAGGRFVCVLEATKTRLGPVSASPGKGGKVSGVTAEVSVVDAPETCPEPSDAPSGRSCCAMEFPETRLESPDATASKERTQAMSWASEYHAPKAWIKHYGNQTSQYLHHTFKDVSSQAALTG